MGLWEGFEKVAGLLSPLDGLLRDAGFGDVAQELERLADRAHQLKAQLAGAAAAVHWSGAAADGFRERARQRGNEVAQLVGVLDAAHSALSAALAMAGVF